MNDAPPEPAVEAALPVDPVAASCGKERDSAVASIVGRLAHVMDPDPERQRLARAMESFSTGDSAALRRMDPLAPSAAATLVAARLLEGAGAPVANGRNWADWLLILHAMAIARGRHAPEATVGKTLVELGFTEQRLCALVEGDRDSLIDLLPRLARRLSAQGMATNWTTLAHLFLHADDPGGWPRVRIARDYARALYTKEHSA
jgi:CRISPR type I-E-associated protein CasB/Cse2